MSKVFKQLSILSLSASCFLTADNISTPPSTPHLLSDSPTPPPSTPAAPQPREASRTLPAAVPIQPFTGAVKGKKVRLRLQPDLEGAVVAELERDTLLAVVGEKGDFFIVEPPSQMKAYIFCTFVLDGVVEGNKVHVRLQPNLQSPVVTNLSTGDKVDKETRLPNSKWLEIAMPSSVRFYIAKEFITRVGGVDVKKKFEQKREQAEQTLQTVALSAQAELLKSFEEINYEDIAHQYQQIIEKYHDLPHCVERAKEALTSLQETYMQRRIVYLEEKATAAREEPVAPSAPTESAQELPTSLSEITDRMKIWSPVEEALFVHWRQVNQDKTLQDYYEEQALSALSITGILEPYTAAVKNKPGDYVIVDRDLPLAYVYSSHINLQAYSGKKVTVLASPRPNNHFAFPAYFVLSIEESAASSEAR